MGFGVRSRRVPWDERGRGITRYLQMRGHQLRERDVCGQLVRDIPVNLSLGELTNIAMILDLNDAYEAVIDAEDLSFAIRTFPQKYGLTTEDAKLIARFAELNWMF